VAIPTALCETVPFYTYLTTSQQLLSNGSPE
jgi:hypothetical protein